MEIQLIISRLATLWKILRPATKKQELELKLDRLKCLVKHPENIAGLDDPVKNMILEFTTERDKEGKKTLKPRDMMMLMSQVGNKLFSQTGEELIF